MLFIGGWWHGSTMMRTFYKHARGPVLNFDVHVLRFKIMLSQMMVQGVQQAVLNVIKRCIFFHPHSKLSSWVWLECRAVASLTVPGGQEFNFPHFSSNRDQFFLFFLKLCSFSSSFWPSGWATRPPGKALAMPLLECNWNKIKTIPTCIFLDCVDRYK